MTHVPTPTPPRNLIELEDRLSLPTPGAIAALESSPGDVAIIGAGGKMGPSLARMVARAAPSRRVLAISRFTNPAIATSLRDTGIHVLPGNLEDPDTVAALPRVPNVFFLAGQKFGTADDPSLTWSTNTVVPALVAHHFRDARIVALSTGNVYPLSPVAAGGSREDDPTGPVGEYAWSCLARERILERAARAHGTRVAIVRLNYAVDLRYGVLVDIAQRIVAGEPVDLAMGSVNVIWQGDACAQVIQSLPHAAVPPFVVNVTGPEVLSVRAAAERLGALLHRVPVFRGSEAPDALLSNASRAVSLFGTPAVGTDQLMAWVAAWLSSGGATLGRATHFEQREGAF